MNKIDIFLTFQFGHYKAQKPSNFRVISQEAHFIYKKTLSKVGYFSKMEEISIPALAVRTAKTVKVMISNLTYRQTNCIKNWEFGKQKKYSCKCYLFFQVGQHNDFVIKDLSNSGATAPPGGGDNMMKPPSKNSGNSNMAPPETETTVVMRRSKSGGKNDFE